jgi:hypothetical protein
MAACLTGCATPRAESELPAVTVEASPAPKPDADPDASARPAAEREPAHGAAHPSPGDAARAEQLFEEGRQLMAAGRFPDACRKLEMSLQLDAALGTMLNLAMCEERAGHKDQACIWWRIATRDARRAGQAERAAVAERRAQQLGCK